MLCFNSSLELWQITQFWQMLPRSQWGNRQQAAPITRMALEPFSIRDVLNFAGATQRRGYAQRNPSEWRKREMS